MLGEGWLTEELVLNVHKVLSVADSLAIRVLDTVLVQNPTAPVITASHDLSPHSTHITTGLGRERGQWVLNVVTARVLGSLYADDIFISTSATLHKQPVDLVIALVFVPLDKVPAQDEVLCDIKHTVTH